MLNLTKTVILKIPNFTVLHIFDAKIRFIKYYIIKFKLA